MLLFYTNIIFHWKIYSNLFFPVTEFVSGGELYALLNSYGILPVALVQVFVAQIALALGMCGPLSIATSIFSDIVTVVMSFRMKYKIAKGSINAYTNEIFAFIYSRYVIFYLNN